MAVHVMSRDAVRACVERALLLDPSSDLEAAIAATAQALHLPEVEVRSCLEQQEQPA